MPDLDTNAQRASSVGILLPFILAPPEPDSGGIDDATKQHIALSFSGILAGLTIVLPPVPLPPSSYIAFQPSAFQCNYPGVLGGFQGFDRYVEAFDIDIHHGYIVDIYIGNTMGIQTYEQGGLVSITTNIRDPITSPPVLFSPSTVTFTLIDPSGVVILSQVNMSELSTGKYGYAYQLTTSSTRGTWSGFVRITNGANTFQTIPQVFFVVV